MNRGGWQRKGGPWSYITQNVKSSTKESKWFQETETAEPGKAMVLTAKSFLLEDPSPLKWHPGVYPVRQPSQPTTHHTTMRFSFPSSRNVKILPLELLRCLRCLVLALGVLINTLNPLKSFFFYWGIFARNGTIHALEGQKG